MPHITWTRGGTAELTAAEDERITVHSTTPSAPGSRPDGKLEDGRAVRMKVHRCRRLTPGQAASADPSHEPEVCFEIEGRLIDATRAMRDHIASLPSASDPSDPDA